MCNVGSSDVADGREVSAFPVAISHAFTRHEAGRGDRPRALRRRAGNQNRLRRRRTRRVMTAGMWSGSDRRAGEPPVHARRHSPFHRMPMDAAGRHATKNPAFRLGFARLPDFAGRPRTRIWWPRTESNRRHGDFQSPALPTELLGQAASRPAGGDGSRIRAAVHVSVKRCGRAPLRAIAFRPRRGCGSTARSACRAASCAAARRSSPAARPAPA